MNTIRIFVNTFFYLLLFLSCITSSFAQVKKDSTVINSIQADSTCPPIPNFNLTAVPPLFSTNTDISVNLPSAEDITIRIYDFIGRLVRTIVSGNLTTGFHHFIWNGTSDNGSLLPSGFYTCIASGMGKADFVKIDLVR